MLTGENGILTQANNSKIEQSHGAVKEAISLAYNEWQIKINTADTTKLASTETVTIKGEEEKALVGTSTTFLQFLNSEGYIKEGTTDVLDVEALTGSKQALGNGTDNDIYKIEEQDNSYVVNYYDGNGTPEEIWSTAKGTETGSVTLDPDTGKEALILVYNVNAGDIIELPYFLYTSTDGTNSVEAQFDFTVDWGDGSTDTITNSDIETKAIHTYNKGEANKEVKVTITGTFESLYSMNEENQPKQGIDKLVRVEQWGTTGLGVIGLIGCTNLTQIAQPTESSFKDLCVADFSGAGITSIPDKMFLNCTKIKSFDGSFYGCTNLQTIGDYAFANCTNNKSFIMCFYGCTNLQTIGEYAFSGCSSVESFSGAFKGTNIQTIGDYAFAGCSSVESFSSTFSGMDSLEKVGEGIFSNFTNVGSFEQCFNRCENLTTIGENIFDGCTNVETYRNTFGFCENLTGEAPELWLTGTNSEENNYIGTPDGFNCFVGCKKLTNYNEIPDYWKNMPE